MFILSPNARDQQGRHRTKYVPNPRHTDAHALAMFEFVGKLMGLFSFLFITPTNKIKRRKSVTNNEKIPNRGCIANKRATPA